MIYGQNPYTSRPENPVPQRHISANRRKYTPTTIIPMTPLVASPDATSSHSDFGADLSPPSHARVYYDTRWGVRPVEVGR